MARSPEPCEYSKTFSNKIMSIPFQDEGGRQVSINLLKVNVEIVNLSFCNMSYDGALTPQAFCAGSIKNGKYKCYSF